MLSPDERVSIRLNNNSKLIISVHNQHFRSSRIFKNVQAQSKLYEKIIL